MQQLGTMGSHAFGPPRVGPFAGGSFGYSGAGSGIYGPNMSALRNSLGGALSGMAGGWGSSTLSSSPSSSLSHLPPLSSSGSLLPPPPSTSSASSAHDHNAIALAQAFQTRLAALSTVAASLLSKREAIAMQLARVQSRAEDVARTREAIEAETLADTEAVLHRLRAVESSKQAILQHDAEGLASDIATIDRFYAALTSYQPQNNNGMIPQSTSNAGAGATAISSGGAPPPPPPSSPLYDTHLALDFMRAYPELCAEADRLTAKTVRQDIDVRSDDFERETASRIDLASKYQALVDLVAAKDRIILQMLREREAVLRERESARDSVLRASSERDQAVEKISQERDAMLRLKDTDVAEWTKLVDVLTGQLVEATEKLARAQGISASSASASSQQQQQQQQQNSQLYGTISPSTSLRSGTGGGSGNASISAVYGSGGGARYGSGGGGGGNQIQNTPPPSNSSQQFRGLSQQQQQQQLMHQNLPPPPMVQGSNQGGGSAFIAKRYQEIIRSTNGGGERSLGVGTALPLSLHPALYSRPPASNSQFSSLATAIPVPAVRSDEAVAFNEYLARSRAGHVPFPESTSKVNNLGLVLPDQGLLQPSPVPEGTPGRIISNMTPPPPPPVTTATATSGGSIPVSVPSSSSSSSSGSVPPSPKWQGETTTVPTAVPVPVVPTVSLTTPSTIVTDTDPLTTSIPSIPPPSAGGEVLNDHQPTTNINTTA
jgi:hypothetical protein